eukprot:c26592_g1_i1 orf=1-1062(-)
MGLTPWMYGLIGAGTIIATGGVLLVILQLILLFRKRMCSPILPCTWIKTFDQPTSKNSGRVFTFKEIEKCCEGFSNLVGETPCHLVYKGTLSDGTEVAVKRAKKRAVNRMDVEKSFHLQVDLLSQIRHQHVANLIGFCSEKHHRMLVFQYAPNSTLYNNLHNDDEHLSWKQRIRVAVGTASALAYLHQFGGSPLVHGDLTSHNVLLAEDYSPKVCGIGAPSHFSKGSLPKRYEACMGPDLNVNGSRGPSDDVYSFGVLLLELVSGKSVFSKQSGTIVEWAGPFLECRDQMIKLVDPTLKNVVPLELYSVCEIARLCTQPEAASRPSMEDVLYMLVQSLGVGLESAAPLNTTAA